MGDKEASEKYIMNLRINVIVNFIQYYLFLQSHKTMLMSISTKFSYNPFCLRYLANKSKDTPFHFRIENIVKCLLLTIYHAQYRKSLYLSLSKMLFHQRF